MRIGFMADTHAGYGARGNNLHPSGLNQRMVDGFTALRETVDQLLDTQVELVLHGGDLFHRSAPGITEIVWVRQQLRRLAAAGIPVIGATGNHDFAHEKAKANATAVADDPDAGITMISDGYRMIEVAPGVIVHVLTHAGLLGATIPDPDLIPGAHNILIAHGVAQVPGAPIFACADSPGEAVIPYTLLSKPWAVTLLGHYHQMGPLPGFDTGGTGQAWYAGSALRRGFTDPAGGRGWLAIDVADTTTTITRRFVKQRPQHDLPVIDAAGMDADTLTDVIAANLAAVDIAHAIIRQKVLNCPGFVRRNINQAAFAATTGTALSWQLQITRPQTQPASDSAQATGSLTSVAGSDLPAGWDGWFPGYANETRMPTPIIDTVNATGRRLLETVSVSVDVREGG